MKLVLLIAFLLAVVSVSAYHELKPSNSEEILNHIQGNNYNIYVMYFYDSSVQKDELKESQKDIEKRLGEVLDDNSEVFYAKIDHNNQVFRKLESVVGVTSYPALLIIVHGKGIWLSGTNSYLMVDRLKDFVPAFKKSSAHHSNPY